MEATQKQIEFAKSLGIKNAEQFSKEALKELISQNLSAKDTTKPEKTPQKAPESKYHLTPEQVRSNALMAAFRHIELFGNEQEAELLKIADNFERYINNGYWK